MRVIVGVCTGRQYNAVSYTFDLLVITKPTLKRDGQTCFDGLAFPDEGISQKSKRFSSQLTTLSDPHIVPLENKIKN
jgi:hypothetical protein